MNQTQKIKIFHPVLCYYPSQAGGPANTLYWINNALNSVEFKSCVVSTMFGVSEHQLISVKQNENRQVTFTNKGSIKYLKLSFSQLRKSDILQFSSFFFPPTIPLLLMAIWKKKAIILSPRGELYQNAIKQKSLQKKLWVNLIKVWQKHINFHATNNFEKELIKEFFPKAKRIDVIPNYIELPEHLNEPSTMKFVFVGRINPIKNIDLIIEAIAILNNKNIKVCLDIVGSARLDSEKDYQKLLIEKIKDYRLDDFITFQGHLDGNEKNSIIASSLALVLPSKSENFGNVVLEALAQGTPVIASKNTPWQLLSEFKAGFYINPNPIEISNHLLKIINLKDEEYTQMRSNAFELCKSKFDIKENIQVWENYYKKITSNV